MTGGKYDDYLEQRGRLIILQQLACEFNGHMHEERIQGILDRYLISRSIEWVRTQLRKLSELGAVKLQQDGGKLIAGLTRVGRDHIERRSPLDGVAWPDDEA
ncbi:hypothetical protein [Polymorphum gilvum]|uniref:Phage related protein n=1 Tax=Polymorphum gilvum (strain LMG 25793 / CGMCC 1.9160 / SL003B-26A1) TaxID=991905 RepID=F2J5M1_POLGS|nr:hypothetical protein [Polymorphum gilvum]ADZ70105.1 hypothetical protein SL003B_1677 [Polymorphum gilvum SL003B-26A1]